MHHPLLRPVFITQFIFNTASFLLLAVFVPYAVRHLGLSATGVGTTLAMYGVGMVVGALVATRVMKRLAFGTVIGLGPVTGFVAAAVMALTTIIPTPLLAGLSFFLLGVGPILWVISTTTLRQSVTPPSLLGRVSAINIMSYGARPLGSALGAIVGGLYGAEACLYLAAAIFGAQALVILSPRRCRWRGSRTWSATVHRRYGPADRRQPLSVMPGLVPGIHVLRVSNEEGVDGRVKPGHDEF